MTGFRLDHHNRIWELLSRLDGALLQRSDCYFGGGTAIVLENDEYRLSRDVDFLCSSSEGYRTLREATLGPGIAGLFVEPINELKATKRDRYGIRTVVEIEGVPIQFEIVREDRIKLSGAIDDSYGVPVLDCISQFAEKLLANADRAVDRSSMNRDAIDLGMLVRNHSEIPDEAVEEAVLAYGGDIGRSARIACEMLASETRVREVATEMSMDVDVVRAARNSFLSEVDRIWPVPAGVPVP